MVRALARPELKERGMKLGIEVAGSDAERVTSMMKSETARMRPIIQKSGIAAN